MSPPFKVVVAGGGVAAVEGLLSLRNLLPTDRQVTLIAPNRDFAYRPMAVAAGRGESGARRYPLAPISKDTGADLVADTLARVDTDARVVQTTAERELAL